MEPGSPFELFCLKYLQPICDLSFIDERFRQEKKVCFCKRSKCKKGYCECFAQGRFCDGCGCVGCHNTTKEETDIYKHKKVKASEE